jgi:signal transduction histidine kinase
MQVLCDLNETVWRGNDLLKPYADERGAIIQCGLCEGPLLLANPLDLEMLVANLTRNAIESKETGAKITISTVHTDDGVRLTVSDDGQGMSQTHARRVFEPLFTTREGSVGTGLGKSIVRRITESHHASIDIDSELGVGTSVRVTFPRLNPESHQKRRDDHRLGRLKEAAMSSPL